MASVGVDKMMRIFDVQAVELKMGIRLSFAPLCCEFIPPRAGRDSPMIVLGEEKSGRIMVVDCESREDAIIEKE